MGVISKKLSQAKAWKDKALLDVVRLFFPESGEWSSVCFSQSDALHRRYLPCHLRDTNWMSQLFSKELYAEKYLLIPPAVIKSFMETSADFARLRHDYELKIVRWQIDWIMHDGENWLLPDGVDDIFKITSPDVDKIVRGGVVKTLRAIGMDYEVIEEGLEKHADAWRKHAMLNGFRNQYNPYVFLAKNFERKPIAEDHQKNWLADREYQYYKDHKKMVDKYGMPTEAMKMTSAEHGQLLKVLNQQNAERLALLAAEQKQARKTTFVGGEFTLKAKDKGNNLETEKQI